MTCALVFLSCLFFQGGLSAQYKKFIVEEGIVDETYDEKKMALFCIQGTSPCNMQAFQVDRVSLSSGNNLQGGGFLSGLQRMKIA